MAWAPVRPVILSNEPGAGLLGVKQNLTAIHFQGEKIAYAVSSDTEVITLRTRACRAVCRSGKYEETFPPGERIFERGWENARQQGSPQLCWAVKGFRKLRWKSPEIRKKTFSWQRGAIPRPPTGIRFSKEYGEKYDGREINVEKMNMFGVWSKNVTSRLKRSGWMIPKRPQDSGPRDE